MPDNTAFLFGAFAITWLLIFGYCLFVGGRIGGLRQDVDSLRDELGSRAEEAAPGASGDDQLAEGRGEQPTRRP